MIGCLPTQALAFLAVFVYATHATQAIAFEWKPGFSLHPLRTENYIFNYADDTYLAVPASNTGSGQDEIIHIKQWVDCNNLRLNNSKSKEIVFRARGVQGKSVQPPPPCMDIERVTSHTMLGVVVNDQVTDGCRPRQQFAVVECSFTVSAPNPPQPRHSDRDADAA